MARTIPATYAPADPDRSFVVGSEAIRDESGGADPHGGGDIAGCARYLYANAAAVHVVPQVWCEDQWFGQVAAAHAATPDAEWFVYPDAAFTDYEVTIYYEANAANAAGFRIKCKDNGQVFDLQTLNVGGGATRRVRGVWTTSGIDALAGADKVTLQLFTAGDGANANEVKGVFIRRVPLAGAIAAGKHYNGAYITPDSSAWDGDKPLTPDKVDDLKNALYALLVNRRVPYMVYCSVTTQTEEFLQVLCPLHGSDFGRAHTYHGLVSVGQDVTVHSGPEPFDDHWLDTLTHLLAVTYKGGVRLAPNALVQERGAGWSKDFGTYVLKFGDPLGAYTHTIEGP